METIWRVVTDPVWLVTVAIASLILGVLSNFLTKGIAAGLGFLSKAAKTWWVRYVERRVRFKNELAGDFELLMLAHASLLADRVMFVLVFLLALAFAMAARSPEAGASAESTRLLVRYLLLPLLGVLGAALGFRVGRDGATVRSASSLFAAEKRSRNRNVRRDVGH